MVQVVLLSTTLHGVGVPTVKGDVGEYPLNPTGLVGYSRLVSTEGDAPSRPE